MKTDIKVYVDGTFCQGKWGGGYAVFDKEKLIYQDCGIGIDNPELNAMRNISGEMSAAMHAALWIDDNIGKGIIVHDYIGLSKWVTGEWQAKKTYTQLYRDFMQKYYALGIIDFEWVKGHTNVLGNEIADKLAYQSVLYNQQWKYQ